MKKKTTHQYKVSVIIPTKNEAKVLGACLTSLANQRTQVPYEILIIDTNSTDETTAIAKKFNVRIIKEPKPGRNLAHHTGAKNAHGDILCFTEADCVLPPTWIHQFIKAYETYPETDAFVGRYKYHQSTWLLTHASKTLMPVFDTMFRILHGHYAFRASNFAIRFASLQKAGGFNLHAKEFDDVELSMRVAKHGVIRYLPKLIIQTGDRRVKGRLPKYLKEAVTNYVRTCILKQTISQEVFADIR